MPSTVPGTTGVSTYDTTLPDQGSHHEGGAGMGLDDKISNEATEAKGKAKETAGSATDNESLESEGKADQGEAKVKKAGEHVKDAAENVKDTFKS